MTWNLSKVMRALGKCFGAALDEGRRHVDADRGDLLGAGPGLPARLARVSTVLASTAFGDEHHAARLGVGGQGQVVVAAPARGLVDGQHRARRTSRPAPGPDST